jgi:hypothetical protein
MTAGFRKFALTAHVASSVGWLGSVAAFLGLAITGLTSRDSHKVRSAYVAMEVTGWYVIVPLSFASLVTGLVQALGTSWGLFRHYWVLAKLLINFLATALLLLHMQPVSRMAFLAIEGTLSPADHRRVQVQLIADAAAALVALVVATALSVYKPRGMTPYGRRKREGIGTEWRELTSAGPPRPEP